MLPFSKSRYSDLSLMRHAHHWYRLTQPYVIPPPALESSHQLICTLPQFVCQLSLRFLSSRVEAEECNMPETSRASLTFRAEITGGGVAEKRGIKKKIHMFLLSREHVFIYLFEASLNHLGQL